MRRAALHAHVRTLIENTFVNDDADVAKALLAEADEPTSGFGTLAFKLDDTTNGTAEAIAEKFQLLAEQVDDRTKDKIADGSYFVSPCAFLASLV